MPRLTYFPELIGMTIKKTLQSVSTPLAKNEKTSKASHQVDMPAPEDDLMKETFQRL